MNSSLQRRNTILLAWMLCATFLACAQSRGPATAEQETFRTCNAELAAGKLPQAKNCFLKILSMNPRSLPALANLGTVYMRQQKYADALRLFRKAEALAPNVAGLELNIGLAYFRMNRFLEAIPSFQRVLDLQPSFAQARHLLGLCYFFTSNSLRAEQALEPLWSVENSDLTYLYVL